MKFSVREVDHGWKKIAAGLRLVEQRKAYVKAGILGGDKQYRPPDRITNVQLGLIHEFGTTDGHVPERSFIRSTFEAKRAQYVGMLRDLLTKVYEGKGSIARSLGIMGAKMSSDMKKTIVTGPGIPPPLAKSTVDKKGSTRPLVDTGRLADSISWEVVTSGDTSDGDE